MTDKVVDPHVESVRKRLANLGDNLRASRIRAVLDISEAARRSGMTRSHISDLERKKTRSANLITLRALAGAYRMTVSELIGETPIKRFFLTAQEEAVIEAMRKFKE